MRIIVVSFTFFPEVDGVANAAGQMVDFFVNAGHEVHVVTGNNRYRKPPQTTVLKFIALVFARMAKLIPAKLNPILTF